jgi:hypothetical protein
MKFFSILVLAMGLAVSACAEQAGGGEQSEEEKQQSLPVTGPPSLLRVTWEGNSCVLPNSSTECWKPEEFRRGDRVYLREIPSGECVFPNANGKTPVSLSFVQDNGRVMNAFFGCIDVDRQTEFGRLLEIDFIDDPVNSTIRAKKSLVIQHVRVSGDGTADSACSQRLAALSSGNLNAEASRVCNAQRYSTLVHWRISTTCELEADSNQCKQPSNGVAMGHPDDGQGTGSGND